MSFGIQLIGLMFALAGTSESDVLLRSDLTDAAAISSRGHLDQDFEAGASGPAPRKEGTSVKTPRVAPGWMARPKTLPPTWAIWPPLFGASVCLLGALAVQNWKMRRQLSSAGSADSSIEILAVKNLGMRHRLALVATCGERLLISASDREVSLLSHLGPVEAEETLRDTRGSMSPESPPELKASSSEAIPFGTKVAAPVFSTEEKKKSRKKGPRLIAKEVTPEDEARAFTLDDLEVTDASDIKGNEIHASSSTSREFEDGRPFKTASFSSDVAGLAKWRAQKTDGQPGQGV